ncbi:MAG TPA: hypothetical protein PKE45_01170 [Caldilineaceae bacterium]|nr:hypothetical protein [Caldilineaceae bacterium]
MSNHDPRANLGWTLVGLVNFVAILLIAVLATGFRPTAGTILGGAALFLGAAIFVLWVMLRKP